MRYRPFGRLDWSVSSLGFGCMRRPTTDAGAIDEPGATAMGHEAIDHGVSYLGTAWPYHGWESERVLGRALRGTYRSAERPQSEPSHRLTIAIERGAP